MEIKQISITPEQAKGKLPGWVVSCLSAQESYSFAAMEGPTVYGLAIFQPSVGGSREIVLRYVYVTPQYRGTGLASEILTEAEKVFAKVGIAVIICRCIGSDEFVNAGKGLLEAQGFVALSNGGRMIEYSFEQLNSSALKKKQKEMAALEEKVVFIDQIEKANRKRLVSKLTEAGITFDVKKLDRLFARFYVEDEEVVGFMNLMEVVDNVMFMVDVYMDPEAKARFMIPAMLSSMLKVAGPIMPEETRFIFQIYTDNNYKGITTVFGPPQSEEAICEMMKRIG